MSDENRELIAGYWLELKQSWGAWREGGEMPELGGAAQVYFERISGIYFRKWLSHFRFDRLGFSEIDDAEAWRISLTYLIVQRPKSSRHLLDDIFERAHRNASEKIGRTDEDELEAFLNWVLSQFKMRMRDVVRWWVNNEKGSAGVIDQTVSTESPVSGRSGNDEDLTLGDFLSSFQEEIPELEREEFRNLAEKPAESVFHDLDDALKVPIYVLALHRDHGMRVSCADPRITRAIGLQKAQLYARRREVLQKGVEEIRRIPEWLESDGVGRRCLECFAIEWMLDLASDWFLRKRPESLSFLLPPGT